MPLQISHRPKTFDDFIGNDSTIESLISALERKDFPRSFLFTGLPGSGKTTLAFILKEEFEINDIDFFYYNSANTRGIDTIRQIANDSKLAPMAGEYKFYVMDECHQITGTAAEAMLLLLENPPERTVFILCTSEPEKMKLALKRRCFQCNLKAASEREIKTLLADVLQTKQATISDAITKAIVAASLGSLGMAVAILDAVIGMTEEEQILDVIAGMRGVVDSEGIEICRALMGRKWDKVSGLLSNYKGEAESLRYLILSYFSKILLSKNKKLHLLALNIIVNFSESFMYSKNGGLIAACYLSCHNE